MHKLVVASALIASAFFALPSMAIEIDLGQASGYNAFIKNDFNKDGSDIQGRLAVGGNLNVNGGYNIGAKIHDFNMGTGPVLVVGKDVNKTGTGTLAVFNDGPHQSPHSGELVYSGTARENGQTITQGGSGTFEANLTHSTQLPVDFDSAFAHLDKLSADLGATTANGTTITAGVDWYGNQLSGPLTFTPTTTPSDNVYVFDITQEQMNTGKAWNVVGGSIKADATIVFNITNLTGHRGKKLGNGVDHCNGVTGCVQLNGPQVSVNGKRLDTTFEEHNLNGRPKHQVLFNFVGATKVVLAESTYGSVLAPSADIKTFGSQVVGQVIGKSWEGQSQINYNPLTPVGSTTPDPTPVPTPATLWVFALAMALLYVNRKSFLPTKRQVLAKKALASKTEAKQNLADAVSA